MGADHFYPREYLAWCFALATPSVYNHLVHKDLARRRPKASLRPPDLSMLRNNHPTPNFLKFHAYLHLQHTVNNLHSTYT